MTLQDQVTSLEISKRLKELGVKQESYFRYVQNKDELWFLRSEPEYRSGLSAFTVAELGEMLKNTGFEDKTNGYYRSTFWFQDKWYSSMDTKSGVPAITADTEADTRGLMLIYLLENKLITL